MTTLNKLVDEYNNTYPRFSHTDYSEEIESSKLSY